MSLASQLDILPPPASSNIRRSWPWPELMLAALAILLPALIGVLKIGALTTWQCTSDLFTHDGMLQETLRGHFFMEYAYGRQLGDHA